MVDIRFPSKSGGNVDSKVFEQVYVLSLGAVAFFITGLSRREQVIGFKMV